jgi:hypothetical protein
MSSRSSARLPFSALRKLLLDLGFVEKRLPPTSEWPVPGIGFYHAPSDCFFVFRAYRPRERVSNYHLAGVRSQLHWRGLLDEEEFDAAMREASA